MRPLKFIIFFTLIFLAIAPLYAQQSDSANSTPQEKETVEAARAAGAASTKGPASIPLLDEGTLALPEDYLFIPRAEGARLMQALGNKEDENFLGLVLSKKDGLDWFITLDYIKSGYVRDDDAKDWKADEMLNQMKASTEEANKERATQGIIGLDVIGWIEPPNYNNARHHLVWSILARDKGTTTTEDEVVNYSMLALGRDGIFRLKLVAPHKTIEQVKPNALLILSDFNYSAGKRYEDFSASTDHVAEFGLAALITGIAAKKLGLFAILIAFLVKAWKIALLSLVVGWASVKKFFGKFLPKKDPPPAPPSLPDQPSS